ncbi:MAG TPA: hypothetical protein VFV96_18650 [Verrucomicrobiae bacterium]|nr:hypothetical protein [Verrucomicrobiae bacterium]
MERNAGPAGRGFALRLIIHHQCLNTVHFPAFSRTVATANRPRRAQQNLNVFVVFGRQVKRFERVSGCSGKVLPVEAANFARQILTDYLAPNCIRGGGRSVAEGMISRLPIGQEKAVEPCRG